jgi:L-alanine-DL-glutamate epimerase-like enolase superfamily enzyme
MRITDVRTILLTGPSTNDPYFGRTRRSAAFVELLTDTELTGLGETYAGYFLPEAVPPIVDFYRPVLVDRPVDDVETLAGRLFHTGRYWARTGLGLAVITALEAALWDLRGKELGVPVHVLLGGPRHGSLLGYATGGGTVYPPERLADKIDFYLGLGFGAFKLGTGASTPDGEEFVFTEPAAAADFEATKLDFVRRHVGPDIEVLLDGHQDNLAVPGWDVPTARAVVEAVEPFGLFLFEEPLPYTNPWGYGELRGATSVPIAGGETLTGVHEWRVFAEEDAFDIAQPDAAFCGGLGEFLRIAALFEARGRRIATHAWGAGGALMQNIHAAFAAPNTAICEIPPSPGPLHREVVGDSFVMRGGRILPPQTPGLGISLPQELRERFAFVPGSGEFNPVPGKPLTDMGYPDLRGSPARGAAQ